MHYLNALSSFQSEIMKWFPAFLVLCILSAASANAQYKFKAIIKDSSSGEALAGVTVTASNIKKNGVTDNEGKVLIRNISVPSASFTFTHTGFTPKTIMVDLTDTATMIVYLLKAETELGEVVIVSSSRTESRIENLPTRVEVLGAEEVNEEGGIKPGTIVSLLGDVAGIQTQQTSAPTGNTDLRIQGLQGRYTQILRDGMPLFGGYSGSFSIMQIPPADIKQVEIIKGASSTLYGGGAIAGLINLVSKKPIQGKFEKNVLLNQTSLNETNANLYLSNRKNKTGFTFYSGINFQKQVDVDKDNYSDLPRTNSFFIHPRLFIYPNTAQTITIGYTGTFETRRGGYMPAITQKNSLQYYSENKSVRNGLDAEWENRINSKTKLNIKGNGTFFNRNISTNVFGMKARQLFWFTEASLLRKEKYHDVVMGVNFSGDDFKKQEPDSSQISNYNFQTIGFFLQDDWRIHPKFIVEAGVRWDHHNQYGSFLLPRISLLYKINPSWSTRLGGGLGYKIPSLFNSEIDERDYKFLLPFTSIKPEKSEGINWDVNFKKNMGDVELIINQSFYITQINSPITSRVLTGNQIHFKNEAKPLATKGFETYVQVNYKSADAYLGYTYTMAKNEYDQVQPYLSLSARNKFAAVIANEFSSHFRAGIEASYTGKQYLDNGNLTPSFLFAAAMVRYDIKHLTFVLNCENLFDYRQNKTQSIVSGNSSNPVFQQIWAPLDGRVVNFSVQLRW